MTEYTELVLLRILITVTDLFGWLFMVWLIWSLAPDPMRVIGVVLAVPSGIAAYIYHYTHPWEDPCKMW